jgi:hypothetical protein
MMDVYHAHRITATSLKTPANKVVADARKTDPDKLMDSGLNEVLLYHGTDHDVAEIVTK